MKKIYHFLFAVLLLGCIDNDTDKPYSEFEETVTPVEEPEIPEDQLDLVTVNVKVSLPEGSSLSEEDLLVSSLLTADIPVVGGESAVNVFEGGGYEMYFAEDSAGNIVLMNYFNPATNQGNDLNSTTTAIAMVMLQPWVTDLSAGAKDELIASLGSYPEYTSLIQEIDNAIISGGGTLLNDGVQEKLDELVGRLIALNLSTSKSSKAGNQVKDPLEINVEDGNVSITNKSAMAYGIRVNDQTPQLIDGADKDLLGFSNWSGILDGNFGTPKTLSITLTSSPPYDIVCDSGSPFAEGSATIPLAQYYNVGKIALDVLSLVSPVFKISDSDCINAIGTSMISQNSQLLIVNNGNDLYLRILEVLSKIGGDIIGILESCGTNQSTLFGAIKADKVLKVLAAANLALKAKNVTELGINLYDWYRYDSPIDFCLDDKQGELGICENLSIVQELDFGKIPVGAGIEIQNSFILENASQEDVTIDNIFFPNANYILSDGQDNLIVQVGQSLEIFVEYLQLDQQEPGGEIEIFTSLTSSPEDVLKVPIQGSIIDPLEIGISGSSSNQLDFPEVLLGNSFTQEIILRNTSDYEISVLNPGSSNTLVDGFNYPWEWSSLALAGNSETILQITFDPLSARQYSETIEFISNSTQAPLSLVLTGEGVESFVSAIIEGDNPDFGQVDLQSSVSKRLDITNNSNSEEVTITFVASNSNDFTIDYTNYNATLAPNQSTSVTIIFSPQSAGPKSGEIVVETDIAGSFSLQVTGEGTENNTIDIFGEWTPTWEVAQCDILGTYCCGCSFHQNARNFIFEGPNTYICASNQVCGELNWQTQQIGSSDRPITNEWTITVADDLSLTLSITIRSGQTSGFQFTDRTLTWEGTYDPETDSYTGEYEANFYGGLIISAEARGTLTLQRVQN